MAKPKKVTKRYFDFSGNASTDVVMKFTGVAVSSAGTLSYQVPVKIGSTTYYLYLYTTGS